MRRIGAHLSIAGGLDQAVEKIMEMGGNCLQIFSSSPKSWAMPPFSGKRVTAVRPVFIHAKYLINLASDKKDLLEKSVASLKYDLTAANIIGAAGVIVHLGSHQGRGFEAVKQQLIDSINIILQDTKPPAKLIIENSAGQKGKLCSRLSEIKLIFDAVNSKRLAWCLDTCHGYNAGLDLGKDSAFQLIQFDLVCLHVNDSRDEFNSGHDRHANLGEGKMGLKLLAEYVNYPRLKHLPLILETPGFDGTGPDKKNLEILKSICED